MDRSLLRWMLSLWPIDRLRVMERHARALIRIKRHLRRPKDERALLELEALRDLEEEQGGPSRGAPSE